MTVSDESDHIYWLHVFTAYAMQALIQKGDPTRVSHVEGVAERAVHIAARTLNELEARLEKMGSIPHPVPPPAATGRFPRLRETSEA